MPREVQDFMRRTFEEHPGWSARAISGEINDSMDYRVDQKTVRRYRRRWGFPPSTESPGVDHRPGRRQPTKVSLERMLGYIVVPDPAEVPGGLLTQPDGLQVLCDQPWPVRVTRIDRMIVSCWLSAREGQSLFDHIAALLQPDKSRQLIEGYSQLRDEVAGYLRDAERHNFDLSQGLASITYRDLEAAVLGGLAPPGTGDLDASRSTISEVYEYGRSDGRHLVEIGIVTKLAPAYRQRTPRWASVIDGQTFSGAATASRWACELIFRPVEHRLGTKQDPWG